MKIKLAFIGNSSSASYYIRNSPDTKAGTSKVDANGVVSGYWLDRWYKWHRNNNWKQGAKVDVKYAGSTTLLTGFSFAFGFSVRADHVAANYSKTSFPVSVATPNGGTKIYTVSFPGTAPIVPTPANLSTTSFTVLLESSTVAVPALNPSMTGITYDTLASGAWSVYYSWDHTTKTISIRGQHNSAATVTSSTAIVIKDVDLVINAL